MITPWELRVNRNVTVFSILLALLLKLSWCKVKKTYLLFGPSLRDNIHPSLEFRVLVYAFLNVSFQGHMASILFLC